MWPEWYLLIIYVQQPRQTIQVNELVTVLYISEWIALQSLIGKIEAAAKQVFQVQEVCFWLLVDQPFLEFIFHPSWETSFKQIEANCFRAQQYAKIRSESPLDKLELGTVIALHCEQYTQ